MTKAKIKVVSSGKYVPETIVTNEDLEKLVDTSDEWIVTRTGIKERRKVDGQTASDMGYFAAMDAIEKANYDKNKIDLIVVATITGDQMTPSTANFIQGKLDLYHEVMSFDINAACTGFVYALEIASSMLQTGNYRAALVIGVEELSKVIDYTDRNTCILFGDGAGAMIVEPGHIDEQQAYFYNVARPDTSQFLTVVDKIKMDGKKVYQFAVDVLEQSIYRILKEASLSIEDIDMIIPHQANIRIIQSVAKSTGISMDKFMINLNLYGNTSAASIPLTIAEYMEQHPRKHQKILLVGFGGGFTYGSSIIEL